MDASKLVRLKKNRENAKKSTGPRDTSQTRYNATKHGLTSRGLTELDDRLRFEELWQVLDNEMQPDSILESFLTERIALTIIRIERASQLEAQCIQAQLHPPIHAKSIMEQEFSKLLIDSDRELLDLGTPAALPNVLVRELSETYSCYETGLEKRLGRYLSQLERLQNARLKLGKPVP